MKYMTMMSAITAASMLAAAPAAADDSFLDLELTVPVALADRSSTGTGADLLGYGYDDQSGLLTGGELRLYTTEFNRYARVGVMAGAQQHAGPLLGLGGYAFRTTIVDAGRTSPKARPCARPAASQSEASTR